MSAAVKAVENLRAFSRLDALALADEILNDTIAALQRDRNISARSFAEWELILANLRQRIAERVAGEIVGYVDLETVLRELEFAEL